MSTSYRFQSNLGQSNGCTSSSSLSPYNNNSSMSFQTSQIDQNLLNEEENKLNLTSQFLKNTESALNCLQFINLIQYYFNDATTLSHLKTSALLTSPVNSSMYRPEQSGGSQCSEKTRPNSAVISTCFPCIVCSSQFSFEQTFHLHLERRSVLIRFVII